MTTRESATTKSHGLQPVRRLPHPRAAEPRLNQAFEAPARRRPAVARSLLRRTAAGACLCAAWLATGCVGVQPSFNELLSEGRREQNEGRYTEALAMFQMAAEIDPERPEPSYLEGRCYLEIAKREFVMNDMPGALRNCDRAIASFHKAIAAFPGYESAVRGEAEALRLRDKHRAALDIADWVAAQSGFRARKLILKAREYASAGDLDGAQLAFKEATSVEPDNARAHAELGLFYLRLDNKEAAIKCLTRAYELNPRTEGVLQALLDLGAVPEYPQSP